MQVEGSVRTSNEHSKRLVYAILLAQLLSIVLAVTGVSSAALTAQGVYAPTTQAFLSYLLLAVVYGSAQLFAVLKQQDSQFGDRLKYTGLAVTVSADQRSGCCSRCSSVNNSRCKEDCDASHAADALQLEGSCCAARPSTTHWRRICRMWPAFAALAFIDVEANVLVVKAYQYTSLTSVTLLDCFTIPSVMLLSWLLLHSRYRAGHFLGAALCISGLAVLVLGDAKATSTPQTGNEMLGMMAGYVGGVLQAGSSSSSSAEPAVAGVVSFTGRLLLLVPNNSDAMSNMPNLQQTAMPSKVFAVHTSSTANISNSSSSGSSAGSAPLLGDALVLLGALLYSICNVTQELLLGDIAPSELLAGIGMFGVLFSGIQAALLGEWHAWIAASAFSKSSVIVPMLGFACAMLCFYSLVPQVLVMGGATVLNISLLSSDAWAALARFLWFGGFARWSAYFFLGSLCMVAAGIVVYALTGSPKEPSSKLQQLPSTVVATGAAAAAGEGTPIAGFVTAAHGALSGIHARVKCLSCDEPGAYGGTANAACVDCVANVIGGRLSGSSSSGAYSRLQNERDLEESVPVVK